jgi:hypothetical protein
MLTKFWSENLKGRDHLEDEQPECVSSHLPSSRIEARSQWSTPLCAFMAWCSIKHVEKLFIE